MNLPVLPLLLDEVPEGLRLALAQEGVPVVDRKDSPRGGRFVIVDSRRTLREPIAAGQTQIDIHPLRAGLASDPFEALLDESSARLQWRIGSVTVSEEVALVDKRALRRRLMAGLRAMLEAAGGIWIKLAAWPFPYRSAFNFRLDHDEFDPDDFEAVLSAIDGHEASMSHYVCASTHEEEHAALLRLAGSDVGSHGYWHHTYYDPQDNLKNIRRGIEVLDQMGLTPSGFVAPHGRFNRGLLWAMEQLGVTHSSEFAVAYDELPFTPPGSSVLQIPVHPICLGIFLEAIRLDQSRAGNASLVADAAAVHLCQAIEAKYHAGEPVFLYGHPDRRLGRYPHVLQIALETAASYSGLWRTDRTTIARWWRQRADVSLSVAQDGSAYVVSNRAGKANRAAAIEYWRGEHMAMLPLSRQELRFSPDAVAYERPRQVQLPSAVRLDQPHSLRQSVRRYLDWEKVTPVGEINTDSLRGWLKKTLRQIRE